MTIDHSVEQQYFVVYRDDTAVLMALHASQREIPARDITYDVWRAVLPIALAHDPVLLAELTAVEVGESLDVGFDEDIRSLYALLAILMAALSPTRAAEIARSWIGLPSETRLRWWHNADCDKPIHAQVLGATVFSSQGTYQPVRVS